MEPITRNEVFLAAAGGDDITLPKPVTREELYLAKIAGGSEAIPAIPHSRHEIYLAKLAGQDVTVPKPVTRLEYFLYKACGYDAQVPKPITREEIFWKRFIGVEVSGQSIRIDDALPGSVRSISVQIQGEQPGNDPPSTENPRPITAYSSVIITITDGNGDTQYTHTVPLTTDYKVYRGTLDLSSGVLESAEECIDFTGEENWSTAGSNKVRFFRFNAGNANIIPIRTCSHYPNATVTTNDTNPGYFAYTSSGRIFIQIRPNTPPNTATLQEWEDYIKELYDGGTQLQCTFSYKTTKLYELQPVDVQLLAGTNVITCNCGTMTLKYTPDL